MHHVIHSVLTLNQHFNLYVQTIQVLPSLKLLFLFIQGWIYEGAQSVVRRVSPIYKIRELAKANVHLCIICLVYTTIKMTLSTLISKTRQSDSLTDTNSIILILKEWALMALINQIDNIKLYSITRMKDSRACASRTVILKTK